MMNAKYTTEGMSNKTHPKMRQLLLRTVPILMVSMAQLEGDLNSVCEDLVNELWETDF